MLLGLFRDLKTILVNVAEQVKKDVNECLVQHAFSQMDEKKAQLLHGQICDLANPGNTFIKLMSKLAFACSFQSYVPVLFLPFLLFKVLI